VIKWFKKRKLQKNCTHNFLSLSSYNSYTYMCKHCYKKVKFSYSWKCEEFELKQMIEGHPIQSSFDYRFKYNKNNQKKEN
jgi:dTDP-4-dehydrorhamnose 3,5-epimerase-like enzyme